MDSTKSKRGTLSKLLTSCCSRSRRSSNAPLPPSPPPTPPPSAVSRTPGHDHVLTRLISTTSLRSSGTVDSVQLVREAFESFDKDGDSMIGAEDLVQVFRKLGDEETTEEEVREIIVESTGTRKLSRVDFALFLQTYHR